ncbi:MAG: type II toxin-antitoxin system VapC family toxin [Acidobacteriota bacterium]|nr:type II toxin-antitoxin system VapC family toxin [Acidobacteriota bacterium]
MILVDTSVWIDHLHKAIPRLVEALESQEVLSHPFVIGELACGEIKMRRAILGLLSDLPSNVVATDDEALFFIERHRLMGKGIGYTDVHLLASVFLTDGVQLWTRDKRLAAIADQLRIGFAGA